MKKSIRQLLVCPHCHVDLECEVHRWEGDEILEGFLHCSCGTSYPIIRGVPRMLPRSLLPNLHEDYPEFDWARADGHLPKERAEPEEADLAVRRRTQTAFGFEWTWSDDYHADNFADWLPEGFVAEEQFTGKIGLEVGCGAGRHAAFVSSLATEHFAVDLSSAVDAAFERNRRQPNCHVVQADAFHLPFRDRTFDYVFCLGVLQHMHDPPEGFRRLAAKPREGGILLVNVYQASRPVLTGLLDAARRVTTRLPPALLAKLSVLAGAVDYGGFILPWRGLARTRLGRHLEPLVPERIREYARHDFHTCYTDWYDRLSCPVKLHFRKEELEAWYAESDYEEVTVTPYWKAFWNGVGRRAALDDNFSFSPSSGRSHG